MAAWNSVRNVRKMSNQNLDGRVLSPVPAQAADGKSSIACGSPKRSLSFSLDQHEDMVDDVNEEGLPQGEKKRRLTSHQVKFLELSFEMENKLEPERKFLIAKQLGLQPRQVAVWFQNRRARWKTKQVERDFDALKANYNTVLKENEHLERDFDALKANYDTVLKENEKLQAEVNSLNAFLRGLRSRKCCAQEAAFGAVSLQEESAPLLSDVSVYPDSLGQSIENVKDLSFKSKIDSPTKSDQSEVLDSGSYFPSPDPCLFRMIGDSAAPLTTSTTAYSDGLLESMYNHSMLLQQVAVKLDGSVSLEENCNLIFSWDEHSLFPWYN